MRISVFPKGFLSELIVSRTMSVFEWIDIARSLDADGLELHSDFFDPADPALTARIGDAVDAAGFDMPMLCASPDFTHPDPDRRKAEFDKQAAMIRITREIGGPGATCRVLSGQAHPSVAVEQGLDWAAEAINALTPLARELDVMLALENHYKAGTWQYPEFAQRRELYLELLDRIDEAVFFGVQFDPSNALVAGLDSAEFLEEIVDRVVTMQASDRFLAPGASLADLRQADGTIGYSPNLQHGVIGRGLNDYDRIFRALTAAGYDGWISIEDGVNGLDELAESVDFLRAARDRWFDGSTAVRVRSLEARRAGAGLAPSNGY